MLPGKMRKYIEDVRMETCAKIHALLEAQVDTQLKALVISAIKREYDRLLEEFDKMERDLWETAGKPGRRSVFEEIFGK
jgi:hypothetical protein